MTRSILRAAALLGCTLLWAPVSAGSKPVVSPPSPPIAITPTVVDAAALSVLLSGAHLSPDVARALSDLEGAGPGSKAAMEAVDALGAAITQGKVAPPVLSKAEAQKAVGAIDRLIAVLSRSGMPAPGLTSLRAAVAGTAE